MKDFCQFLRFRSTHEPVCAAGINFYSVGEAREICRVCPLAGLGDAPICEDLDVLVYQDWRLGSYAIRVEVSRYDEDDASYGDHCSNRPGLEDLTITTPTEATRLLSPAFQRAAL